MGGSALARIEKISKVPSFQFATFLTDALARRPPPLQSIDPLARCERKCDVKVLARRAENKQPFPLNDHKRSGTLLQPRTSKALARSFCRPSFSSWSWQEMAARQATLFGKNVEKAPFFKTAFPPYYKVINALWQLEDTDDREKFLKSPQTPLDGSIPGGWGGA